MSRLQDFSARFQILVGVGSLSTAAIMLRLLSRTRLDDTDLKLFGLLDLAANLPVKTTPR